MYNPEEKMIQLKNTTSSAKINFYMNLLNFTPFLFVILTGLVLQLAYHFNRMPENYTVLIMTKSGWLILHKISAAVSLSGIITHCVLHRKYIISASKKIINLKQGASILLSYYLFILLIPTCLTVMISWIFLSHGSHARSILVEIHDKLALILILLSGIHIISRMKWMINMYQKIRNVQ
jgi:hypothetical protein